MVEQGKYAVIGATGKQGGAVVDALLERSAPVIAIVRDPESDRSRALADRGVDLRTGDQEDPDSLAAALTDLAGLFFITTYTDDVESEVRRGISVADAAVRAEVPLVVYSSVGGAERNSGIPHFDSKRRIEEHLERVLGDRLRIVRPVYFMDNLTGMIGDADPFILRIPMPATTPLQMVAVRDIGRVAAALLLDPSTTDGTSIEIAGDELTPARIATLIGEHLDRPSHFEQVPLGILPSDDLKAMFSWFADTPAYQADFPTTKRLDPDVWDLAAWLAHTATSQA